MVSSVTESMIINTVPFTASSVVLIAFLTVLIMGVNYTAEMLIRVLIMLAQRLICWHNCW